MSSEPVAKKCFVCAALANAPNENRESEIFLRGYMAGVIHAMAAGEDSDAIARLSIEGLCAPHAIRMIANTRAANSAFAKAEQR